jgi:hypothetical protein
MTNDNEDKRRLIREFLSQEQGISDCGLRIGGFKSKSWRLLLALIEAFFKSEIRNPKSEILLTAEPLPQSLELNPARTFPTSFETPPCQSLSEFSGETCSLWDPLFAAHETPGKTLPIDLSVAGSSKGSELDCS